MSKKSFPRPPGVLDPPGGLDCLWVPKRDGTGWYLKAPLLRPTPPPDISCNLKGAQTQICHAALQSVTTFKDHMILKSG
eukprot:1128859-Prorocentrum_minimum.AAC.1